MKEMEVFSFGWSLERQTEQGEREKKKHHQIEQGWMRTWPARKTEWWWEEKKIKNQDEKWVCIYRWRQELLYKAVRNSRTLWHSKRKLFFFVSFLVLVSVSLFYISLFFTWIHKKNPINLLAGIEFPVDWTKLKCALDFFFACIFRSVDAASQRYWCT